MACMFRANYLYLSDAAHTSDFIAISNRDTQIFQLALKKLRDPQHFDLQEWLTIRNERAMEYITDSDIEAFDIEMAIAEAVSSIQ